MSGDNEADREAGADSERSQDLIWLVKNVKYSWSIKHLTKL